MPGPKSQSVDVWQGYTWADPDYAETLMMQSYSARVLFERFYQVKVLEAIKASRNELGARMQHRLILRVVHD